MQGLLMILGGLLCIHHAKGADQILSYSATYDNGAKKITFDIEIFKNDDTVTAASIPDPSATAIKPTGTNAATCKYSSAGTNLVNFVDGQNGVVERIGFQVVIDYSVTSSVKFESSGGTDLGCTFTTDDIATGEFHFLVRGLSSLAAEAGTDREYEVKATGNDAVDVLVSGSTVFQGVPVPLSKTATTTSYTFDLAVVDSPAHAVKTTLDLGKTAQLKFTMTINAHEAKMDFGGARVTNCIVDKVSSFDSLAVTFIGSDGCFEDVDIFENVHVNVGFTRDGSSSKTGSTKTYIAYSPKFEMSAFTRNPFDGANALYFKCDITPCLEDTDSVKAGQCGAGHCDPTRKKRDIQERSSISVIASVNLTRNGSEKSCNKCSGTTTFQASLGGLATITAAIFGLMTLSFTGARNTAISFLQKHRKSTSGSIYSKHSCVSSRSVTGTDVTSDGGSLPRKSHA